MTEQQKTPLSLKLTEAQARRALLEVTGYDVTLDLTGEETFSSRTRITFASGRGETFLDLKPVSVDAIVLDGRRVDPALLRRGRVPLSLEAGDHELVVEAVMRFRNDGEGLHRAVDPADGAAYVYGMSFMDAAPSIFACFDQPDLKAPYTFHVRAPREWSVFGNAPGAQVEPGVWEFETSQPLSTYFVTLVAGPWHVVRSEHDGIPLSISCRASIAQHLDADVPELFRLTEQCFDEFHRLFGIRYPFGNYHQAFVPEFNAGAMENPGCVTFRDPLVFTSKVTRGERIQRATTIAHEMAHQWFGNIVTPAWWDDLWLNESFAEYMGNRVTATATEYADAWDQLAWTRRQWGLMADQAPSTHPVAGNGAVDATAALQDFDGISYAKGSSVLKQLNARLGDDVFFAGAIDHFERHRFGNATMHDLFGSWERAGAGDLSEFVDGWLRVSGLDALRLDRGAGMLLRRSPDSAPDGRAHRLSLARLAGPDASWQLEPVTVDAPAVPLPVAPEEIVVVDPHEETWALTTLDAESLTRLPAAITTTTEPAIRSSVWNGVRSGWHNAEIDPHAATALAVATLRSETVDFAVRSLVLWLGGRLLPLHPEAEAASAALYAAASERAATAEPGSGLQLAAFQGAVATTADTAVLRGWLAGELPAGIHLDTDLRWRILGRLARTGAAEVEELDRELAAAPDMQASVHHARSLASRPTSEAKAWAWQRFLGEVPASNYELEAIGLGMWQSGQEELTRPYVDRFLAALPGLPEVHSGWVLGDAIEVFFPRTELSADLLSRAEALSHDTSLDPTVRRRLTDAADRLRRDLAVVERWPRT
ncbi:aminopeptidase N [Nocardioides daejeonensis]|uniref:aminopeptidase N n=1 Tax=Nocardioides daejeonensis TaxID=1046556 RepID=UPI000D74E0B2|nr:aminopeptidase N [Nocardioides daejeonensis]